MIEYLYMNIPKKFQSVLLFIVIILIGVGLHIILDPDNASGILDATVLLR